MARVLPEPPEGGQFTWKIRCVQARGGRHAKAVEGCLKLIEVEPKDFIVTAVDSDGDSFYYVTCPSCGLTLYPSWQMLGVSSEQIRTAKSKQQKAGG